MNTTIRNRNGSLRNYLRYSWLLSCAALIGTLVSGCQQTCCKSGNHPAQSPAETAPTSLSPQTRDETRIPVPLLPRMAQHQLENMRDHLATIQEIMAAMSKGDFAAVEQASARIGYSEQMGQMCEKMGAGAPGFNEMALNFHHTADTIGVAARQKDATATLKAVSATLQTCVGCHAVYRQQIVDEATWGKIMSHRRTPIPPNKSQP